MYAETLMHAKLYVILTTVKNLNFRYNSFCLYMFPVGLKYSFLRKDKIFGVIRVKFW